MRRQNTEPMLVILHGKHGDTYFHARNDEDLEDIYCKIFDLNEDNQYYCFYSQEEYETKIVEIRSKVEKMSNPKLADIIDKNELQYLKRSLRHLQYEREDSILYEKAKSGDKGAKYVFVDNRRDSEYETVSREEYHVY